jgi:hypothetical protein
MDLIEDLDPEDARAIFDPALKTMIDAARSLPEATFCNDGRWKNRKALFNAFS